MIIDCFTHTWETPAVLGRCMPPSHARVHGKPMHLVASEAGAARHLRAAEPVHRAIVLGFKSHYLGADISNDKVASLVRDHSDRLIGFAGIDPTAPREATTELRRCRDELGLKGLAIAPAAQDFHPCDSHAMQIYAEAAESGMPVIFHTGPFLAADTKMEYARPMLLDAVARDIPGLKIIVAHLGYPWLDEMLMMLAKHANVFAEVSWIVQQPWSAYQALLSASQLGVMDKLLFGSGFPIASASLCIESLYGLNHLVHTTNLPPIPRDQLRGIVERDALSVLGLSGVVGVEKKVVEEQFIEEEEFEVA